MKENLSTVTTSAGVLFVMWLFFYFPTFHGEDIGLRLAGASMGILFAKQAFLSGKLVSRLERCSLIVSVPVGMAVLAAGLIAHYL